VTDQRGVLHVFDYLGETGSSFRLVGVKKGFRAEPGPRGGNLVCAGGEFGGQTPEAVSWGVGTQTCAVAELSGVVVVYGMDKTHERTNLWIRRELGWGADNLHRDPDLSSVK